MMNYWKQYGNIQGKFKKRGRRRGYYLIDKPPSPLQLILLLFHVFQMKLKFKFKELFKYKIINRAFYKVDLKSFFLGHGVLVVKENHFNNLRLMNKDHQAHKKQLFK
jgi:hypothetical protein